MFQSFFIGGFECSTHRGRYGKRHDVVHSTKHDLHVKADYSRLREIGISTAREGLRWHLIESSPERYDFSSVLPFLQAAKTEKIQILWDLFHYGYPDDIDPFSPDFPIRFAQFAYAFANFLKIETDATPFICPFNEISFYSFAGGERGFFAPYATNRGDELKANCVRAAIEATKAVRGVTPGARFMQIEPSFHIAADPRHPQNKEQAERYRMSQFEAWDMIAGRKDPQLGGAEDLLDIIGVNFYGYNQWFVAEDPTAPGTTIQRGSRYYRPFHQMLLETYSYYNRPMFVAETGTENEERPDWLRYICEEVRTAQQHGAPISGICWYPILNHPGWDDDRHCHNGLWDYCDADGCRQLHKPLAAELKRQRRIFEGVEQKQALFAQSV